MNPRAASLGAPPTKAPAQRNLLGEPPQPTETKNNILKDKTVQLNVRVAKEKHREIRIAAMNEDMDLMDYIVYVHDKYQQNRGRRGA